MPRATVTIGSWTAARLRAWATCSCGRDVLLDIDALPADMTVAALEAALRCRACGTRGAARLHPFHQAEAAKLDRPDLERVRLLAQKKAGRCQTRRPGTAPKGR